MNLNTVRIFVRDLPRARDFYAGPLGLPLRVDAGAHGYCVFDAGAATLVVESVPANAPLEDQRLVGRFTGLSLAVPDVVAEFKALSSRGVRFAGEPERQAWGGTLATLNDPEGNQLQIHQLPAAAGGGPHAVRDVATLEALFGAVGEASLRKEVDFLHPTYRAWIAASPFAVLATAGPEGLDASPRGDPPSLVTIQDEHTLLLPERRGNNRIDSLRNILADPRVALLFFVPGVDETLRVNGRARITVEPGLLQRLAVDGAAPKCVIEVAVESVFFQCGRAMKRSRLWARAGDGDGTRAAVPTAGAMLEALTDRSIDGAAYDRELPGRQRQTLY